MTIYRVEHNKNYCVINNTITRDVRLSWKAKGLWLYAFSRPDDWSFYLSDIINQSTDGEKSVYAGLKELEDCGYLVRDQERKEDGKFKKVDWVFYETPREIKIISPQPQKGDAGKGDAEKQELPSTEELSTEELNIKTTTKPPPEKKEEKGDSSIAAAKDISLTYKNIKGEAKEVSQSDVFTYFLKLPYSTEEIQLAIEQVRTCNDFIGNIFKYLEAICLRIHNSKSLKINDLRKKTECVKKEYPPQKTVTMAEFIKRKSEEDQEKNV